MRSFIVLVSLFSVALFAQTDSIECYRSDMVDAIIKCKGRSFVFETYEKWELEGNPSDVLSKKFDWVFRDGEGNLLNDAELLSKVNQEDAAERMREIYRVRRNKGNVRMFVGVPLGIAMTAIGAYWLNDNFKEDEPSVLDQAGAVVLGVAGIGVTSTATYSFIDTRKINPYKHDVTGIQSLDVLNRHDKAIATRCRVGKK